MRIAKFYFRHKDLYFTLDLFYSSSFNDEMEMNEVTDEYNSDPIDIANTNIFTNDQNEFKSLEDYTSSTGNYFIKNVSLR